ncbi:hypothetical protein [Mucilaginibacter sp.]|jgi:hypothetical protein|uniref:hypothetical protein n=1 Tax=Mucilaginibacter sp. TaxID=1882438 RepID=UPI00356ABD34
MTDNPLILDTDDPVFLQRATWFKKQIQIALNQPFLKFDQITKIKEMGLYLIYDKDELLYIGMTTRKGHLRLSELSKSFRTHTFNRKLVEQHIRGLGHQIGVLSPKTFKRNLIESELMTMEDFKAIQIIVNEKIAKELRFKFYETRLGNLEAIEHYSIALLYPLYNF